MTGIFLVLLFIAIIQGLQLLEMREHRFINVEEYKHERKIQEYYMAQRKSQTLITDEAISEIKEHIKAILAKQMLKMVEIEIDREDGKTQQENEECQN